ncbi:MAG: DUF444 family protein [Crenarchaeota archaeon]|nr:MAG: DUF444 family protein [Thermoproteota archaeon]
MPRRIEEDRRDFRDRYSGRIRSSLKKFINNGRIFRTRPNGGHVPITIPRMDIPHIVHGNNKDGVGRGGGEDGDIIQKGPEKGKGKGNKGGDGTQEGVEIALNLEDVLQFLQQELQLPNLKPKPNEVLEEEEIKYTSISLTGPESLRHNRRTMLQALKRQAAAGNLDKLHWIPGFSQPVKMITPINTDRRYRQYRVIQKPSSNAVIFFARDGSASMDEYKCDIVSDMSWWIDIWIRRFYERVERCYIWHDTYAQECDENKFYTYRYGGGTKCSSAFKLIAKQFENRFPPNKWNIYVFYFTDGENWNEDNNQLIKTLHEKFPPEVVNLVGITQVMAYGYENSLRQLVINEMAEGSLKGANNIKTTAVGPEMAGPSNNQSVTNYNPWGWGPGQLTSDERDAQIKRAITDILGTNQSKKARAPEGI